MEKCETVRHPPVFDQLPILEPANVEYVHADVLAVSRFAGCFDAPRVETARRSRRPTSSDSRAWHDGKDWVSW